MQTSSSVSAGQGPTWLVDCEVCITFEGSAGRGLACHTVLWPHPAAAQGGDAACNLPERLLHAHTLVLPSQVSTCLRRTSWLSRSWSGAGQPCTHRTIWLRLQADPGC